MDGKYFFATQTDGTDTCKSPIGLFESMYIPNDLKSVDEALRIYYGFEEEPLCSDCKNPIIGGQNKTVRQIIEGSQKVYNRQLCLNCVHKLVKAAKENAAKTVSE